MRGGQANQSVGPIRKDVLLAALVIGLALSYLAAFILSDRQLPTGQLLARAFFNAIPQVVLAVPLFDRVAPRCRELATRRAVLFAAVSVALYAVVSYAAVVFLLALTGTVRSDGILVRFFSGPAAPWQIMQGCAYGLVAIMAGLWRAAENSLRSIPADAAPPAKAQPPARWLVKTAEGIVAVAPADIVHVEAAGEYSYIVLDNRRILSRIGMGECARRLARESFLRVHRSHLVAADAIVNAESAGNGRLQLSLRNGDSVVTSREGARIVRANAV